MNSNRSHGFGNLNLKSFQTFPKNPAISKVFREIGLADELGSGMRNTYKYTKLYSGGTPIFEEGDVFKTIIPISTTATAKVGPDTQLSMDTTHDTTHDIPYNKKTQRILGFCSMPRSRTELQEYLEISNRSYFQKSILKPLLEKGLLVMTIPDKPKSKKKQYVARHNLRKGGTTLK